ncbi:MAG TPA: ATP-binding protein [Bryobacteraceae bacterium]|jgi:two-component system phosphate regulon sensor histidine kinase PhoR
MFWCAFLATALGVMAAGLVLRWPLRLELLFGAGGAAISLGLAFGLSRPVDLRIARMRVFSEGLLEAGNEPAAASMLGRLGADELEALDRSLLRMAGQTRVLVERAKVESARREAILASMAEGVLAVDERLRVTFCNQALARLAGSPASSGATPLSGMPLMELVRDTTLHETLSEVIRTGNPAKRNLQIPAANGRSFELQAAPLISGNKPGDKPGAIAILHDITDLERLENVRKDFVANVSHEFRTPLAAISGYAETLLDGAIEDQQNNRRFLEIIRSNAIRLNSIAADLLTLSELQGGSQNTEQVPVREAIDSALSTIAAEAASRSVTVEKGPIDNVQVLGSRYRLEQALVNLIANAVKFNRPSGKVRVETRRNGSSIGILVSDTGMGIPSSDLPRIFERFYRVDKARSRQVGGTGLGLSIVKHIVERMDGRVSASSQLGKGSVFTITLPLN